MALTPVSLGEAVLEGTGPCSFEFAALLRKCKLHNEFQDEKLRICRRFSQAQALARVKRQRRRRYRRRGIPLCDAD